MGAALNTQAKTVWMSGRITEVLRESTHQDDRERVMQGHSMGPASGYN